MSKPDDIPQDVWEAAEREACAQRASDYQATRSLLPFTTDEMNEAAAVGQVFAADEIAAALRKRGGS